MSIKYAILGALTDGPKHGYAIRRELNELLGLFWPINQGQVYATLGRMASRNLVDGSGRGTSRQARRPFALQSAGSKALVRWLSAPCSVRPPRSELLAKLVLHARSGDQAGLRHLLAAQRARCRQAVQSLARRRRASSPTAATRDVLPLEFIRRAALLHIEAELEWLDFAERTLFEHSQALLPEGHDARFAGGLSTSPLVTAQA
jgi:DNA-binding PadR family transcriptional regulator